ncbi:hypothetical protein WA026_017817 [Henosepilachna vigintioctopunctata]|uniref:CHK kinase-like domain-containing protein n=1 Tax=Henosepilachna vigintioctopunctata TaxID=420089 RepID=A0AAW1TX11_9CUCU
MNVALSQNQKHLIDQIAQKEGFKYYKLSLERGSLKGDGYMGTITVITVEESLTKKKIHLVLKAAQTGDQLREKAPIRSAFIRENFIYNVVFKEFSELQKEYNVEEVFDGTAKYYGGLGDTNEECLVLENLKEVGFTMWNRQKPMDSQHVEAVMTQYGKLHALSYAFKKLKPEKYDDISKNLRNIFENIMSEQEVKESTVPVMERALKAVHGNERAIAGLKTFFDNLYIFFEDCLQVKDKYTIIIHGDCWCNNIMFRYEGTGTQKPSKVYLLDWQLSSTGSPILDISYFFYACSSKHCIDNYKSFLKVYYDSLSSMLKQFGVKIEEVMSFEDLQLQWRIYSKYGMYMAILIIKLMLAKQEEAPELEEMLKENKNVMDMFDVEISQEEEYNERISNIINHMVYNENMSSMLEQFGVKVEEIMSFQELEQQWQIYSKFGMYTAILLIKMMLTKQEQAPEWKELVKENKTRMDMFHSKISNEE